MSERREVLLEQLNRSLHDIIERLDHDVGDYDAQSAAEREEWRGIIRDFLAENRDRILELIECEVLF